jgi:hypothetical protein
VFGGPYSGRPIQALDAALGHRVGPCSHLPRVDPHAQRRARRRRSARHAVRPTTLVSRADLRPRTTAGRTHTSGTVTSPPARSRMCPRAGRPTARSSRYTDSCGVVHLNVWCLPNAPASPGGSALAGRAKVALERGADLGAGPVLRSGGRYCWPRDAGAKSIGFTGRTPKYRPQWVPRYLLLHSGVRGGQRRRRRTPSRGIHRAPAAVSVVAPSRRKGSHTLCRVRDRRAQARFRWFSGLPGHC